MTAEVVEARALPLARLAALPGVSTASGVASAAEHARTTGRVLPVSPALSGLLPAAGLRRGSTVSVLGSTSLMLTLLAAATAGGAWAVAVGLPTLGVVAAAELGVEVGRLALVPRPGPEFPAVTAALLDGFDLVVVGPGLARPDVARRLSARARNRGSVLLSLGSWPGAEVELSCRRSRWTGFTGDGAGYLRAREVEVRTGGRGAAARPRSVLLRFPGEGEVRKADFPTPAPATVARWGTA